MLGSRQLDALQNITGSATPWWRQLRICTFWIGGTASGAFKLGTSYTGGLIGTSIASYGLSFDASLVARTSVETRGKNTAYYPRIHA